jgi:ribonuclease BN (tRNA processing enzyme)
MTMATTESGGMGEVLFRFLGSGDAFGSGGRLHTSFHVQSAPAHFLIDCGPSALGALKWHGADPGRIDAILLSHLHGDHFGGVPFFILDAHFVQRRTRPLAIAGPPGVEPRVRAALAVLFPGAESMELRYPLAFVELPERTPTRVGALTVTPFPVVHPSGAPSYALRVGVDGRTIAYSGDTEWTEALVEVAGDADLFVCECYLFDSTVNYHLSHHVLVRQRDRLRARRILLTHMSDEMLRRLPDVQFEWADDGLVIAV